MADGGPHGGPPGLPPDNPDGIGYDPETEATHFVQLIESLNQAGESGSASRLLYRAGANVPRRPSSACCAASG